MEWMWVTECLPPSYLEFLEEQEAWALGRVCNDSANSAEGVCCVLLLPRPVLRISEGQKWSYLQR